MTTNRDTQWAPLLRALADELAPDPLADPTWRAVFESTPRHVFVPGFYAEHPTEPRWIGPNDSAWLPTVYSDVSLITQIQRHPDDANNWWPTSSSSRPSLMLFMLHALDATPGMRVLEIGTGTGYNTALVAARLGDEGVVSLDIDPELITAARNRLARLGYLPRLIVGDGSRGRPEDGPYDRIIATHSVEEVPYAWVDQTRPGGMILVDVRSVGTPGIGHLTRLTVDSDGTATGDFRASEPGNFMPTRLDVSTPNRRFLPARNLRDATSRPSAVAGQALRAPGLAFAVWAALPQISMVTTGPQILLFTPDGSWATATTAPGPVQIAGSRDLWTVVENVHHTWQEAGRPTVADYTITVTPHGQTIAPDPQLTCPGRNGTGKQP